MSDTQPIPEVQRQYEVEHMLDTMRKGQLAIEANGRPVTVGKRLGAGGSKTVYDAVLDENSFALALPNTTDGYVRMMEKWSVVEREPENTAKLRELGLLVNPICEILPATINGISFPALRMTRYEDLPFEVRDSKNLTSSVHRSTFVPENGLTDENFRELFSSVTPDLLNLLKNRVSLHQDSINICIEAGKPRLYLNDLGDAEWNGTASEFESRYYAQAVIRAFAAALTEDEWQTNKSFFETKREVPGSDLSYFETFGHDLYQKLTSEPL